MRISTRGSYALEAVVAIALLPEDQTVSIREISERTQISDNYLEQIFSLLRKNNIITSSRGAYGGYLLARKSSMISVGDVLRATEKSISPVLCAEDNDKSCPRAANCVTKNAWRKLSETINQTVNSISIAEIAAGFNANKSKDNTDYSI